MSSGRWVITVPGGFTKYGVDGTDAMIITVPRGWYATIGGQAGLLGQVAAEALRKASEQGAEAQGRRLHHADWIITSDPRLVEEVLPSHHCPECYQGNRAALRHLADAPGNEVALGVLHYAAEPSCPG